MITTSKTMQRFTSLLFAILLAPLVASAHHQEEELFLAHEKPHKVVYLLWKVGDAGWKIPMESMEQCEALGPELIESRKISKQGKGYECIAGLM